MHALGHLFNECLVNKGTAHKLIDPQGIPVKPTWHKQGRTSPKAKIGEQFAFSNWLLYIHWGHRQRSTKLTCPVGTFGSMSACVFCGLMLVASESWLFSCDAGNTLYELRTDCSRFHIRMHLSMNDTLLRKRAQRSNRWKFPHWAHPKYAQTYFWNTS